jgi:hypothetical protein
MRTSSDDGDAVSGEIEITEMTEDVSVVDGIDVPDRSDGRVGQTTIPESFKVGSLKKSFRKKFGGEGVPARECGRYRRVQPRPSQEISLQRLASVAREGKFGSQESPPQCPKKETQCEEL